MAQSTVGFQVTNACRTPKHKTWNNLGLQGPSRSSGLCLCVKYDQPQMLENTLKLNQIIQEIELLR